MVRTDLKSRLEKSVKPFVKNHGVAGEVYLLNEAPASYYSRLNSKWSSALPATLLVNTNKKRNEFYNADFTMEKLNSVVKAK